ELHGNMQRGFEILLKRKFILDAIDIISLFLTVIPLMLLIFLWCKVMLPKSSDDALKELKMHLEYVSAREFEYRD
ncbi:459_t:CDS:2, partial [Gigaspora rosea]